MFGDVGAEGGAVNRSLPKENFFPSSQFSRTREGKEKRANRERIEKIPRRNFCPSDDSLGRTRD